MFGLFTKKPSVHDAVKNSIELARGAQIQVVLENGMYSGFVVTLDTKRLAESCIYEEAISAFVSAIDRNIANGRFYDPSKNLGEDPLLQSISANSSKDDTKGLPRIVASTKGDIFFKWALGQKEHEALLNPAS